jgi:hypothetical protein
MRGARTPTLCSQLSAQIYIYISLPCPFPLSVNPAAALRFLAEQQGYQLIWKYVSKQVIAIALSRPALNASALCSLPFHVLPSMPLLFALCPLLSLLSALSRPTFYASAL